MVSFQDRATLLGDNDPMIERCRFHEERLATIVHKIDGEVLPAGCADGLRDDLARLFGACGCVSVREALKRTYRYERSYGGN